MKATFDLPDDLVRTIKLRAVREDRRLKDLVAELLRLGLTADSDHGRVPRRVQFPIIKGGHPAPPGEEMTPDRLAAILADQDVDALVR